MGVEASIILQFGDDVDRDSAKVTIELDDESSNNIDSDGNLYSSFLPSMTPEFLIQYNTDRVYISAVKCTDGFVNKVGTNKSRSREKETLFTRYDVEETKDTNYLYTDSLSFSFRGKAATLELNDNSIRATSSQVYPCVADCSFQTLFQELWRLTPPSLTLAEDETYSIYVVVYVENVS